MGRKFVSGTLTGAGRVSPPLIPGRLRLSDDLHPVLLVVGVLEVEVLVVVWRSALHLLTASGVVSVVNVVDQVLSPLDAGVLS